MFLVLKMSILSRICGRNSCFSQFLVNLCITAKLGRLLERDRLKGRSLPSEKKHAQKTCFANNPQYYATPLPQDLRKEFISVQCTIFCLLWKVADVIHEYQF